MSKTVFYRYNPSSDSYDRVYPSWKRRALIVVRHFIVGIIIGVILFLFAYNMVDFPREKELRNKYDMLLTRYELLDKRLGNSLAVMEDLAERDNNFYRVMMQADRISPTQRYAGLENRNRYGEFDSLPDGELLRSVSRKLDMLERQIYTQIRSFDKLKDLAGSQKDRLDHIPAIQPISQRDMKQMASGFGYRIDPIYGTSKFHEGMDFASATGTPVYATGNATVLSAGWNSGYGKLVELNHGYGYVTRYAHLSEILVKPGQKVNRGDLIGKVGNTGKSTGSHLHYEVRRNGAVQNPVNYYFYDITPEQYAEMIQLAENAGHVMD